MATGHKATQRVLTEAMDPEERQTVHGKAGVHGEANSRFRVTKGKRKRSENRNCHQRMERKVDGVKQRKGYEAKGIKSLSGERKTLEAERGRPKG